MIELPSPPPLFNPITSPTPLTPLEVLAGPFGLLAFVPLIPALRGLALRWPRFALIACGAAWVLLTAGPACTAVLAGGVLTGVLWIAALAALRRLRALSEPAGIALVWIGLHALILPLWLVPNWSWYASRTAPLHHVGFAYFLLRLVAWGVDWCRKPESALRPIETICWLLYPPCMRLGPVLPREVFFERLANWQIRTAPPWAMVARRFGLFILGAIALGVVLHNTPKVAPGAPDFFSTPSAFATEALLRVMYLVPIGIYLLLWTYNELAMTLSLLVGIPVDNNFDWLPRSTSVREFWRRWHVTVGVWMRNYIYLPLGGNRRFPPLLFAAVFGYCAVWHGWSWSFVLWGASQAAAMWAQRGWDDLRRVLGWDVRPASALWRAACWLLTMHYQVVTIMIFADFEHSGLRLLAELFRRIVGGQAV